MLRAVRLKFLFLFVLTVIAIVFVLPSLSGGLPGWWEKHVSRGLKLGLDLKGGMHLILQVDLESAINNALTRDGTDMKESAEKRGLAFKVGDVAKQALPVTLANRDEQAAFLKFLKEDFPHLAVGEPKRQDGGLVFDLLPVVVGVISTPAATCFPVFVVSSTVGVSATTALGNIAPDIPDKLIANTNATLLVQ